MSESVRLTALVYPYGTSPRWGCLVFPCNKIIRCFICLMLILSVQTTMMSYASAPPFQASSNSFSYQLTPLHTDYYFASTVDSQEEYTEHPINIDRADGNTPQFYFLFSSNEKRSHQIQFKFEPLKHEELNIMIPYSITVLDGDFSTEFSGKVEEDIVDTGTEIDPVEVNGTMVNQRYSFLYDFGSLTSSNLAAGTYESKVTAIVDGV